MNTKHGRLARCLHHETRLLQKLQSRKTARKLIFQNMFKHIVKLNWHGKLNNITLVRYEFLLVQQSFCLSLGIHFSFADHIAYYVTQTMSLVIQINGKTGI